jgi:hypothetical protein
MMRLLSWSAALMLLVAAWLVAWITPDGTRGYQEPFAVAATVGEPVVARNLAMTIDDLALADGVSSGRWSATGTWLVVTADAWVVRNETEAQVREAFLTVGDRTFRASERPGNFSTSATLFRFPLTLELPRRGAIAFELPEDVIADSGVLQFSFGNGVDDPTAHAKLLSDAVIELPVDLSTLPRVAEMELPVTEWAPR